MKLKNLIIVSLLFVAFAACKRDVNYEGPDLNDIYGDFAVLQDFEASVSSVNFTAAENVFFTARFSTITDWRITITSGNSENVIEGRSKIIDATNSTWDGSSNKFPSFATGNCTATLFVLEDSSTQTVTVNVTGTRTPEGTIVADFESGIKTGWTLFKQSGANMSFVTRDTGILPQGDFYFDMGGEVNWDWLIGYLDITAASHSASGFGLSSNPTDLYFNLILKKKAGLSNGILLLQFKEDDNGDGSFTESAEDMYSVEVKGNDLNEDWTVYSIKYIDLKALVNGAPSTPNGNGQYNPDKLHTISALFLADPSSGYSQTDMDFLIFTEGAALKL